MPRPLLLVHSSGLGPRQWRATVQGWRDRCPIEAIPLGGYEGVPWEDAPGVLEADAALVAERLVAPTHLVGHSYGGTVALLAALARPQVVASLLLYEPTLFFLLDDSPRADVNEELAALRGDPSFLPDHNIGTDPAWMRRFIDYWNAPGVWDAMPEARREALLEVGAKVYREVQGVWTWSGPLELEPLRAPVTVAYGERTTHAAREMARILAERLPRGRLATLPGQGHLAPVVDPASFALLLEEHLYGAQTMS